MFFKPFAAYDKRIRKADGSAENLPPRYNWNIFESGIKHHKPNLFKTEIIYGFTLPNFFLLLKYKYGKTIQRTFFGSIWLIGIERPFLSIASTLYIIHVIKLTVSVPFVFKCFSNYPVSNLILCIPQKTIICITHLIELLGRGRGLWFFFFCKQMFYTQIL
jgi:hypothetical protein